MSKREAFIVRKYVILGKQIPVGAIVATSIALLLYLTSINHGFVLDDNLVITSNTHIQKGVNGIPDLLKYNYAHGHDGYNDGLSRPLSLVSFAIGQQIHGLNPFMLHLMQAIFYALLILVLYWWLAALFSEYQTEVFWIIMLFAVHPIHTEVVANIKSRDELFALLFFGLAAWQFTRWINGSKSKHLLFASLWMVMASFSKESAVTFIAVIPLIAFFKQVKAKTLVMGTTIMTLPIAFFLMVRQAVLSNLGEVDSGVANLLQNSLMEIGGFAERFATAAGIQGLYLQKLFIPIALSHDYSFNAIPVIGIFSAQGIFWIGINAILIALGIWGLFKRAKWSFGILFYYITIAVVANLFVLIGAMAAERFLFAPSLGWCIAIVFIISHLKQLGNYRLHLLGSLCLVFSVLTVLRIPDWKSNFSLFTTDVVKVDDSARAHYNAGTAYSDEAKKRPRKAREYSAQAQFHLQRAVEIWPDYQDAYNNLGISYMNSKAYGEAYEVFAAFIKRYPEYSKARYNMGMTCFQLQKYSEAEAHLEAFLKSTPNNVQALYIAAESEGYQSKMEEAIEHLNQLIAIKPNHAEAILKLGLAYGMLGNSPQAFRYLSKAVELSPNDVDTRFNLAVYYTTQGENSKALEELDKCLELNPNFENAKSLRESLVGG
ncbi:MAG: tetratricopeptide repeat protein [Salibacteraceae bacterium]